MHLPRFIFACGFVGSALSLGCGLIARSGDGDRVATGGTSSNGGTTPTTAGSSGNGGSTPYVNPCPETAPSEGSSCEDEGLRCAYGNDTVDYLCTRELEWREREYAPADEASGGASSAGGASGASGAGGEAGAVSEPPVQPESIVCEAFQAMECPQNGQCTIGCGGSGAGSGAGCAAACVSMSCGEIPATQCPADRCSLFVSCEGTFICGPSFHSHPVCGVVGYYGQDVQCCDGLSARCGAVSAADGSCVETAGYYIGSFGSVPMCMACGDGTCEDPSENPCNCPEDCGD